MPSHARAAPIQSVRRARIHASSSDSFLWHPPVSALFLLSQACTRSGSESQELGWHLIQVGGRIGHLTSLALHKVKERLLVVKQVEKIKAELNRSPECNTRWKRSGVRSDANWSDGTHFNVPLCAPPCFSLLRSSVIEEEIAASSDVSVLHLERLGVTTAISSVESQEADLLTQAQTLQTEIDQALESHALTETRIQQETTRVDEIHAKCERRNKSRRKAESR